MKIEVVLSRGNGRWRKPSLTAKKMLLELMYSSYSVHRINSHGGGKHYNVVLAGGLRITQRGGKRKTRRGSSGSLVPRRVIRFGVFTYRGIFTPEPPLTTNESTATT